MKKPPRRMAKSFTSRRRCRVCGCSEYDACWHELLGACWWVQPDLCSHCAKGLRVQRDSEIAADMDAAEEEYQRRQRDRARRRARMKIAKRRDRASLVRPRGRSH
jgi:hypothetical protein